MTIPESVEYRLQPKRCPNSQMGTASLLTETITQRQNKILLAEESQYACKQRLDYCTDNLPSDYGLKVY